MSRRRQLSNLIGNPAAGLKSTDPSVRRVAVAASAQQPKLLASLAQMLTTDSDPKVRRECAEVLGRSRCAPLDVIAAAMLDPIAEVREAAATALGEIADPSTVELLISAAANRDEDRLVREAAVAALGAIEDPRAVPTLIELATSGPPQIRRRCVPALSVFDGNDVEAALRRAAVDRNPMVREAAEMVVGRSAETDPAS